MLSLSDNKDLIITQSPHGSAQSGMALDFGHLKGNAPETGKILAIFPQKNPQQDYFHFGKDHWFLQLVHTLPVQSLGKTIEQGKSLWQTTWHHIHVAINVNNKWQYYLAYVDWSKVNVWWWRLGMKHPIWTNRDTYGRLNLYPKENAQMIKAEQTTLHNIVSINTTPLNIRLEPNTSSRILGQIGNNTSWKSSLFASGTVINGNSVWWSIIVPNGEHKGVLGWVSSAWLNVKKDNSSNAELQRQLEEEKKKNERLIEQNKKYKPAHDAAILIQNIKP